MNLCIDQGNSRTKVALFDADGHIVKHFIYKSFKANDVEQLFQLYPLSNSIISSVINLEPAMVNVLHRMSKRFVLFDHHTPVPIVNDYETPATLGQDRLAAAVGARFLCPDDNLLIIDAGSAITYDIVSAEGHYVGGNIAPGFKMRFTSLSQMTKLLPQVDVDEHSLIQLFGRNTHDAIAAGVVRGICFEVKGYMRTLKDKVEHYRTFLTGGNANYILNNVKETICYEKYLVLIGLNCILEYNTK